MLRYGILILLVLLIGACHSKHTEPQEALPDYYPVFPGCEHYQSKQVLNWCFVRKFSDSLEKIIRADTARQTLHRLVQTDTVWFALQVDTTGRIILDSIYPTRTANYDAVFRTGQKWIGQLPAVQPAVKDKRRVNVSFNVPVLFRKTDESAEK